MNTIESHDYPESHNTLVVNDKDKSKYNNYGNLFNQDSSRVNINQIPLTGVGINRWTPLFFDPQKNSIEPFQRGGNNSVLNALDSYVQKK